MPPNIIKNILNKFKKKTLSEQIDINKTNMQYSVTEQMTKKVSDEFKNESNKFQFNKFIKEQNQKTCFSAKIHGMY